MADLPSSLSDIFKNKQRTYKMVLILSLLEDMWTSETQIPIQRVADRFLSFYLDREAQGKRVESPPKDKASHWSEMNLNKVTRLLFESPIPALASVLVTDLQRQWIGFRPDVLEDLNSRTREELKKYALEEIDSFYQSYQRFSLRSYLTHILSNYITAKSEPFRKHPLGAFIRQQVPKDLKSLPFIDDQYRVQGSVGQGNWATIPWIAIMDKRITESTQYGEYIVYLFSEDMSSVYLTLNQGVTLPLREKGKKEGYDYLIQKVQEMRGLLSLESFRKDDQIHLTQSGIGRDYQVSTVAYKKYEIHNMPSDDQLFSDLENLMENYQRYVDVLQGKETPNPQELDVEDEDEEKVEMKHVEDVEEEIQSIKGYIQSQGFYYPDTLIENFYLSLKTKPFVILAGISGTGKTKLVKLFAEAVGARMELIPVRPDWSDPSDLLGYRDLSGEFRKGRLTEVFIEANQPENKDRIYFICLDEMNLARVEHYFSDVLSVMETEAWQGESIVTERLIAGETNLPPISIPDNVYIIGTVNMDETTHPFSKKVLDRAQTIEFNYINLQLFLEDLIFAEGERAPIANAFLKRDYLTLKDAYQNHASLIQRTTEKLVEINNILEEIQAHVGFRVRDTFCFYLIYNERFQLLSEEAAFDLQILQKILPRIQGSSYSVKMVLIKLMFLATDRRRNLEDMMNDSSELLRDVDTARYPQTARKIAYMLRRLEEDGFTSFWLS